MLNFWQRGKIIRVQDIVDQSFIKNSWQPLVNQTLFVVPKNFSFRNFRTISEINSSSLNLYNNWNSDLGVKRWKEICKHLIKNQLFYEF